MANLTGNQFNNLSLKDLVEARDLFHIHLLNKKNVVGTAIGRYLIRKEDIDEYGNFSPNAKKSKRTLNGSLVLDISWPCILVFVKNWEAESELANNDASDIVPKTIYMPDGRVVPICIVEAPQSDVDSDHVDIDSLSFPRNLIGGGCPLIVHRQGIDRVATIGCILTDGHTYYALTNRHVAGDAGTTIQSKMGLMLENVGISSGKSINKLPFSYLYQGWKNSDALVCCDVGLIEISDLRRWKTEIVGINRLDEMVDISTSNLTLSLIAEHRKGKPVNGQVIGYGAVGGLAKGEIKALFYRYRAMGGAEYMADFLIGARNGESLNVRHGDSGMLWLLEGNSKQKKVFQPFAVQWGHHDFTSDKGNKKFAYSLSTCLSNVCRELDVEFVRSWNSTSEYIWGKIGHYTIARFAIDLISNKYLKSLIQNNLPNITFQTEDITIDLEKKNNPKLPTNPKDGLCPLADAPDIWLKQKNTPETPWGRAGDENPNHYADADAPTINDGGTLFDICSNVDKMTVTVWQNYYKSIDKEKIGLAPDFKISKGLICFRIWQIYDYMVKALQDLSAEKFIFAAGLLCHYVGDCAMPLHSSYMSDGDPADNVNESYTAKRDSTKHKKGDVYDKITNPGKGVHSAYEDHMVDDHLDTILQSVEQCTHDPNSRINTEQIEQITSGQTAAFASLRLMKKTQDDIQPKDIVEAYKQAHGSMEVSKTLYDAFGVQTAEIIARSCRYLAAFWDAAWENGSGGRNVISDAMVDSQKLIELVCNPNELPSKQLDTIEEYLML